MIEVRSVSLKHRGRQLFDSFSVSFADPGIYLVLGANGSGKSLLTELLCGGLKPQHGSVLVDGEPVYRLVGGYGGQILRARAEQSCLVTESLEVYLEGELLVRNRAELLNPVWPILEDALNTSRRTPVCELSHGQYLLSQIALGAVSPARVAVLDGHLTYLDAKLLAAALQLLDYARVDQRFLIFTAARLAQTFPHGQGLYLLAGGLPVRLAPLTAGMTVDTALAPQVQDGALRIYFASAPRAGITSSRSYTLLASLEDGIRIKPAAALADVLAELAAAGVEVRAIEWESPAPS